MFPNGFDGLGDRVGSEKWGWILARQSLDGSLLTVGGGGLVPLGCERYFGRCTDTYFVEAVADNRMISCRLDNNDGPNNSLANGVLGFGQSLFCGFQRPP